MAAGANACLPETSRFGRCLRGGSGRYEQEKED